MPRVGRMVKESMLQEISTELSKHQNFFVTRVNRLSASDADALRQKLHASKGKFLLVQRRLGLRALDGLKIPGVDQLFEGSVGLVLPSDDVLPIAKTIVEFIKSHEDQLVVRGGLVDGAVLDRSRVEQLASLPPRPVLLTQLVFTIESPLSDVIFTIEQLIGDVAWTAEQAAAAKPTEPSPPAPEVAAPQASAPSPETKPEGGPADGGATQQTG